MHQQHEPWEPETSSFSTHCDRKPKKELPMLLLQPFKDSTLQTQLPFPISARFAQIKFIAWNPLQPIILPSGASVLWLECEQLVCQNSDCFANGNRSSIVASWSTAGTPFDGTQPLLSISNTRITKLSFKIQTNSGPVSVTPVNGVMIAIELFE